MKKTFSGKSKWLEDDFDDYTRLSEESDSSSKSGLPLGWKRATFILKEEHINKLKACAYWERITLKELIEEVIVFYLNTKKIIEIPPKKQRTP